MDSMQQLYLLPSSGRGKGEGPPISFTPAHLLQKRPYRNPVASEDRE
jgi:hypothetical protein